MSTSIRAGAGRDGTTARLDVATAVGTLRLEACAAGLARIHLDGAGREAPGRGAGAGNGEDADARAHVTEAARQLLEYFAGARTAFELALAPAGTEFQRSVWSALTGIPFGSTISYAELARRVGRPRAFRAVGGANGANPLPIVVPCHRVIAADGGLGGYSGGLEVKMRLLALESAWPESR